MSMALEIKLILVVLDVSFNGGHYTVIIKRRFFCTLIFAVFLPYLSTCLSNIEVIRHFMAEIQLLPVSENKGGTKI